MATRSTRLACRRALCRRGGVLRRLARGECVRPARPPLPGSGDAGAREHGHHCGGMGVLRARYTRGWGARLDGLALVFGVMDANGTSRVVAYGDPGSRRSVW